MRFIVLLFIGLFWSTVVIAAGESSDRNRQPEVAVKKARKSTSAINWYATTEFRHHINTYYEPDNYLGGQEPSGHARLQIGSTFYEGFLDAYGTIGVFKEPRTQRVRQRRPEVALDVYPYRNQNYSVLQYNLIQLPFDDSNNDPESDAVPWQSGTIYTVGLAPTARYFFPVGSTRLTVRGGIDGWTKLYSRTQYVVDETNETDPRLGLDPVPETDPGTDSDVEDFAQHYFTQATLGVRWDKLLRRPNFLRERPRRWLQLQLLLPQNSAGGNPSALVGFRSS